MSIYKSIVQTHFKYCVSKKLLKTSKGYNKTPDLSGRVVQLLCGKSLQRLQLFSVGGGGHGI